ncbi:hypothetical protein [Pseudomonas segetis]|uniref:Uncharacterized protein n=1 Tax=Pseudomonas segetis TaxID=298908 RepID=A0A239C6J1_9PSED|nr:hypothetical protein [Pseudomonas segetis]SNS15885.1 hypothetical protein SAMN05216255_1541 [Pseudomonas segetis]
MAKTYKVLERSYINGRLYEPGETLELEIDRPGSNLELVKATKADKAKVGDESTDKPADNLPDA